MQEAVEDRGLLVQLEQEVQESVELEQMELLTETLEQQILVLAVEDFVMEVALHLEAMEDQAL
jgi:hypothetical protein